MQSAEDISIRETMNAQLPSTMLHYMLELKANPKAVGGFHGSCKMMQRTHTALALKLSFQF